MLSLVGCSSLLGIEDPRVGGDDDGADDAGVDALQNSGDHLELSLGDISVMQRQRVKLHVKVVRKSGDTDDVTGQATYRSDNSALVTAAAGQIDSVAAQVGQATITASYGDAEPATIKVAVRATTCHPVINEVATGSAASPDDEFVELYNPCTEAVEVAGWTLNYRSGTSTGATDSSTLVTLAGTMAPGELRVYGGAAYTATVPTARMTGGSLGQKEGAVGLRSATGTPGALIDSVGYAAAAGNPFIEGATTSAMANGFSLWRQPFDGNDSDNNAADFKITAALTPGAPNVP